MSKEAREQALKFLVPRMRCEQEVRQQLRKKGHSQQDIDDAIDYLYSFGYLDDGQFCEAFIHDRIKFNPCGRLKLIYDLRQKGIDRRLAEEAAAKYLPWEDERELARALWQKKARQVAEPEKIKRYLSGKGFDLEIILSIAEEEAEEQE